MRYRKAPNLAMSLESSPGCPHPFRTDPRPARIPAASRTLRCRAPRFLGGPARSLLSGLVLLAGADADPPNLALVARPSASATSGDTSLDALNDGNSPRNSLERGTGSYGNWPQTGTQWVQYDWPKAIHTDAIEVYWWDDHQGVRLPAAHRVLYWDGKAFVEVEGAGSTGIEADRFNRTTFNAVVTDRLRLEIDGAGRSSTGILEWRVLDAGDSPNFPPAIEAGSDRVVMLDGKTYLNGEARAYKGRESLALGWSKAEGPGTVTFADPRSARTTATFSELGTYTLRLEGRIDDLAASDQLTVQVMSPPEDERLDVVYTTPYRIDNPLWSGRARALIVNWIPHCIRKIEDRGLNTGGIDNFVEAAKALAGQAHEGHKGLVFSNAWVLQTVESMCIALMVDARGDREILEAQQQFRETLENWIPTILAAQEPDGYLQTAYTLADRRHWPEKWNPAQRQNHEGYIAGYFLESAINHYMLTDGTDTRLYDAAKKLADCWVENIGPEPGKKAWYDEHQEMEQALVRFGRFVNDMEGNGRGDAYIGLAKFLLDNRGGGHEYDQSHLPVQQQYEAVGHAVRASYTYSGMADIAAETGDTDYESAVMSLWDNIVNRKHYVTGGIGSGESSEGFGPDYSLRHDAYCESCSSTGMIFFEYKLNLAYHDAKFASLYEEVMYNALLGSIDLAGENFYYQNPLNTYGSRYDWHVCPCCVGNIPRTLLMIPTWTYVTGDDGLYVNLFIGSTIQVRDVAGTDVEVVQETDYPWDGKVAVTVNPKESREFALRIRVPDRDVSTLYSATPEADGITGMSVNGEAIEAKVERGYAVVTRTWKAGDRVEFEVPMVPQIVRGSDKVEATRGQVALRYGPLVYCVERVDQEIRRAIDTSAPLTMEWKPDLLGGVKVMHGKWADGDELVAIPYYARANRDGGRGDGRFGGPGATGGGDGARRSGGPSSTVWIQTEP